MLRRLSGQTVTVLGFALTTRPYADPTQVLAHSLIVEAIRFSPADRPDVTLEATPEQPVGLLRVRRGDGLTLDVKLGDDGRLPHRVQPTQPPAADEAADQAPNEASTPRRAGLRQALGGLGEGG